MTEISPGLPMPRDPSSPQLPPPPPPDMSLQLPGHVESFNGETPPIVKIQQKRWEIVERLRSWQRKEKRQERRRDRARLERFRRPYATTAHVIIGIITSFDRNRERRAKHRQALERRMGVQPLPSPGAIAAPLLKEAIKNP